MHGDIRTDHILIEKDTGRYRWIDFDYTYEWSENPSGLDFFGLGNILLFAVGKSFYPVQELRKPSSKYSSVLPSLSDEDFSLYSRNRIMNLRKLFPYIPESLNLILMSLRALTLFTRALKSSYMISVLPAASSLVLNQTHP